MKIVSYGTPEIENVSKIFYDHGVVYFSGEFHGKLQSRIIGNFNFINSLSELNQTKSYLSFIPKPTSIQNAKITSSTEEGEILNVNIFPNPFSDELVISFKGEEQEDYLIMIQDLLGVNVFMQRHESNFKENKVIFQEKIPSGIYFLRIQDSKGNIYTQKIIKQ